MKWGKLLAFATFYPVAIFEIYHQIIWKVTQNDIRALLAQIENLIGEENLRLFGTTTPDLEN